MKILVINCGSSSLKYDLIDMESNCKLIKGQFANIGTNAIHKYIFQKEKIYKELDIKTHSDAMNELHKILIEKTLLIDNKPQFECIAHRVVHGGEKFFEPTRITEEVKKSIEELSTIAPLHNPVNLMGINLSEKFFPGITQIAVFDTAFHQTMPAKSYLYGVPYKWHKEYNIRRYGFHGISHDYVSLKTAEVLNTPVSRLKLITCHLGNGASVAAINYGQSIDTTMGFSPLEGLIMGTRSGDIDPSIIQYLVNKEGYSLDKIIEILNKKSGLLGISEKSRDMQELLKEAAAGNKQATIAIKMFIHKLTKVIGGYMAILGGADAIIFTGGIGENSAIIRERVCHNLEYSGAIIDEDINLSVEYKQDNDAVLISTQNSHIKLFAVQTDEEWMIAKYSENLMKGRKFQSPEKTPIPIGISARHIHLSAEDLEKLFGKDYKTTPIHALSQPGQFVCEETITLKGPKREIANVRILGPIRKNTQIEISRTDEFALGVHTEIRASGDIKGTPGITLIGPKGELQIKEGVIKALRHIHMAPADAKFLQVEQGDLVRVKIDGSRELIFGDVLVRVSNKYRLEMHIDTDEANSADLSGDAVGYIVGIQSTRNIED